MKTMCPAFRFGCLLLAGAALTAFPASAQAAHEAATSTAGPSSSISGVEVAHTGRRTTVRITGAGELRYQTSRLNDPERLVLDFVNTRLAVSRYTVPSKYVPVRSVRLGQSKPDLSRVVIDLAEFVPFSAHAEGSDLTISFASPAEAVVPAAMRPVRNLVKQNLAPARAPRRPLPAWLTGKDLAFARPANGPAAPEPQNPPADAQQAAGAPAPAKQYTGDPISVNLKDVDLKDFFRLIHEISGLNVVLDPAVRGTVTLVLDEVPWDQGLDIVLRNNGLTQEIDGNVLRIATQDTLRREADQRRDLLKAQADAVEQVTSTRVLSYAKATAMRETLRRFLSPRGEILADERSNTLIIRDIPTVMPQVDNLIRQLDRKGQQVEIEARVVSATRSFARDIGTQFGFATTATHGRTLFGGLVGQPGFTSPISSGTGIPPPPLVTAGTTSLPFNTNLPAGAPTSGISFAHRSPNVAVDFIISAAEAKGVGKLLSKPKVITQNNEKAVVKQGTKIPVQTTINNTISVQFIDAVLKLEVTPQITAEGTVFMDVLVENTQIDAGIPRVS